MRIVFLKHWSEDNEVRILIRSLRYFFWRVAGNCNYWLSP
jgi:hypothetical protein